MSDVDVTGYRSRVAEIALGFESALTNGYRRTIDATGALRRVDEGETPPERGFPEAIAAMEDARPEVPESDREEWDEIVAALEEAVDDA